MLRLIDLPGGSWATRWTSAVDPAKLTYVDYRDADFNCQRTPSWDGQDTSQLSREYATGTPEASAIEHVEIAADERSAVRDLAELESWMDDCQSWYPNGPGAGSPRSDSEPMHLVERVSGHDGAALYANTPGADGNRSPDASVVAIGRVGRAVVALWVVRNDDERTPVDTAPVKTALVTAMDRLSATLSHN